ncbi:hypothetical protein HXX76_011532 [Chlamydomonas incerta]|uniref:Protein YIP n=1 Tax=Chlamydomonas incerta TaxID=51695 RepID=A0A835VT80_CHLIN|nr:hypothetical protein HXX76_011532 [Chlamydomonas incerta]|eukprot:KAG2428412.1 hypothetical protein HXX76_011532 [Chlamydomonas incerta]
MSEWTMRPGGNAYGGGGGGAGVEWFSAGAPSSYGSYAPGYGAAAGGYGGATTNSNSFEEEPPLLEELGIDVGAIFLKTRAVLMCRFSSRYLDDLDMGGALLFVFLLAGLQLLMGKLHFGVTLGWSVVCSLLLWFLLRQLAGAEGAEAKNLDLYGCCCVVGYSMLPLVGFAAAALLLPRGPVTLAVGGACTAWAALTASRIFARRCPALEDLKGVIMYPCVLTYATFALLVAY